MQLVAISVDEGLDLPLDALTCKNCFDASAGLRALLRDDPHQYNQTLNVNMTSAVFHCKIQAPLRPLFYDDALEFSFKKVEQSQKHRQSRP